MGLKLVDDVEIPLAKLYTKFQTPLFMAKGNKFERLNEYLPVGEEIEVYEFLEGNMAYIGNGLYIKEVDPYHFNITFGKVRVLNDDVVACSKTGYERRKLLKGVEYNVIGMEHLDKNITLYRIDVKEYVSAKQAVEFVSIQSLRRKK
jgi:hypothetical protein